MVDSPGAGSLSQVCPVSVPAAPQDRSRPTRNPASAVYGTVLAGSLIAVQGEAEDISVLRLVVVVLVTQSVYWLAHSYAELVGERVETGVRPRRTDVRRLLGEQWPLVSASFLPLTVVALAWLLGSARGTAVLAGLWTSVVVLALWALVAGRRARLQPAELLLYVAVSAVFGLALVVLKVFVH